MFYNTHNNFVAGRNTVQLSTYKLSQNGIDIIDPQNDYVRKHANSVEMQRTCFGAVKLHPINDNNGIADWDYHVCGSVLLAHPGHPHREDYETSDIHSVIPYGISNTNVSEYEFTYFNNHEVAAAAVWRGEMQVVLESYRIVSLIPDYKQGSVEVKKVLN